MEKKNQLKFITIEGIDGAGKSTYIPMIKNFLESQGQEVIVTREPGGTDLGEKLRTFLPSVEMTTLSETLLMFAPRAQHIEEKIKPALESNKWVICDRFTDSTMAYQHGAKGLAESKVKMLETLVQEDIRPGLTLIFDVPLNISKERLSMTKKVPDKFERESDEFFYKTIKAYKKIIKKDPARCKIIDSSRSIDQTNDQVLTVLQDFYREFENKPKMKLK